MMSSVCNKSSLNASRLALILRTFRRNHSATEFHLYSNSESKQNNKYFNLFKKTVITSILCICCNSTENKGCYCLLSSIWESKSEFNSANKELISSERRNNSCRMRMRTMRQLRRICVRVNTFVLYPFHMFTYSRLLREHVLVFVFGAFLCFRCAAHVMVFVSLVFICTKII